MSKQQSVPEYDVVDVEAKAVKEATTREQTTKPKVEAVKAEWACRTADQQKFKVNRVLVN
jgi:hypothetical protein